MKEFTILIQNEPTNEPVNIQIKMGTRGFSEVKLYIPKENGKLSVVVWNNKS